MIINEGVRVRIGGDSSGFLRSLRSGRLAAAGFATAVVASLGAVAVQSAKMTAQLNRDLNLVATLGGEAKGSTKELREEVKRLGIEYGRSFNEIARANYQAVSAGHKSIAKSMEVTRAGTRLAVAGNADLVASTEAVAKALNAFGESAGTAEDAAAQLWGISRDGIITVEQLSRLLKDLPAVADLTDIGFKEMAAALSTITAQTGHAESAIEGLRMTLVKLEAKGFTGSLLERIDHFAGKSIPEIIDVLGDETASRMVALLASNIDKLRENTEAADDVVRDFNEAVSLINSDELSELAKAQQEWNDTLDDLGQTIAPLAAKALHGLAVAIDAAKHSFAVSADVLSGGSGELVDFNSNVSYPTPGPVIPIDQFMGRPAGAGGAAVVPSPGNPSYYPPAMGPDYLDPTTFSPFVNTQQIGPMPNIADELGLADLEDATFSAATAVEQLSGAQLLGQEAVLGLASMVSGQLVAALGLGDSAMGQFVSNLLSMALQLGLGSAFPGLGLLGFSHGGFTGSRGGIVHPNEYVFSADAVDKIGLGRLERMHAMAGGGETNYNLGGITVNAPNGDAGTIARMTAHEVGRAIRELHISGMGRHYRPINLGGR